MIHARMAFGGYRFWYSCEIQGRIKGATVKKDVLGDWYITLTTDSEGLEPEPKMGDAAGFDNVIQGMNSLLSTSKYQVKPNIIWLKPLRKYP